MITRRNIRIKAFQTIYELTLQDDELSKSDAIKNFDKKLDETHALFASISQLLYGICDYVIIYANQKASKHLPTKEDLNISLKLTSNQMYQGLKRNQKFIDEIKKHKLSNIFEDEMIKRLFLKVVESPEYKSYLSQKELSLESDRSIMEFILKICVFDDENTISFLSEKYMNLYNDDDIVRTGMERVLLNPANFNFSKLISFDKLEYAHDLLACYYDKKDIVFHLIEPKLVNWDADRVAIIDKILLHLGICELLYFPTIPVKVTINEYIDLAKAYGAMQSGQFINGLLDNVRKDLEKENKIVKHDFQKK